MEKRLYKKVYSAQRRSKRKLYEARTVDLLINLKSFAGSIYEIEDIKPLLKEWLNGSKKGTVAGKYRPRMYLWKFYQKDVVAPSFDVRFYGDSHTQSNLPF